MAKNKEKLNKLKHYCYLITNLINNKVYVGVTYKNINERLKEHIKISKFNNDSKKQAIHKAIAKYGLENFSIQILSEYDNANSAYEAEIKYIAQFKSTNKKYGYNQSLGGDRGPINMKYTINLIISTITDFCDGVSLKEIAIKNNIPYHSVFDITRLRISSSHNIPQKLLNRLSKIKLKSNKRKRVGALTIINLITGFINDLTMEELSDRYNLSINNVWNIIHRNIWKKIDIGIELENKLREKLSGPKYWRSNER